MEPTQEQEISNLDDSKELEKALLNDDFWKKRKQKRWILIGAFFLLATVNTIIFTLIPTDDTEIGLISYLKKDIDFSVLTIGGILWGFILSLIFSFIPKLNTRYKHRYFNTAIFIGCLLNSYFLLIGLFFLIKQ